MGKYELIKGEENGVGDPKRNLLPIETIAAAASVAVDIKSPRKPEDTPSPEAAMAKKRQRLVSLDVFRGATVALMILVDDVGGLVPAINHSPWNNVTIADFVMPFFLFMVGVSLTFAYKRVSNRVVATKKAFLRTLKLLILGLVLQGGYFHGVHNLTYGVDILSIRLMGVLQRIAVAYLLAATCEIWLRTDDEVFSGWSLLKRYRFQLLVALILSVTYMSLLYGLYVPDWDYQIKGQGSTFKSFSVKCGVRGDTSPACNAVGMIDRKILGIEHLYRRPVYARTKECSINSPSSGPLPPAAPSWCQAPFDPEGILSTVMAIVSCLIGLQFGHVMIHFEDHKDRIVHWMVPSFSLMALAFSLDFFGMHINKALYTFSYTCLTTGAAGLFFSGTYLLVDVYGIRRPTYAFEWMGVHALMIYSLIACNILPILIQGFYWREPENNLPGKNFGGLLRGRSPESVVDPIFTGNPEELGLFVFSGNTHVARPISSVLCICSGKWRNIYITGQGTHDFLRRRDSTGYANNCSLLIELVKFQL